MSLTIPDPKELAPDATNIVEMVTTVMELFFGGNIKDKLEGFQKTSLPLLNPTIPKVPFGVPRPTIPPELAASVGGVGALGAVLMPILQMLTGVLQFLDGKSVAGLMAAADKAGSTSGGASQHAAAGFKTAINQAVGDLGTKLGKSFSSIEDLTQDEMGQLLAMPAPPIPGLTGADNVGDVDGGSSEGPGSNPEGNGNGGGSGGAGAGDRPLSFAGAVDKLMRALPVVPVSVPATFAPNPEDTPNPFVDFTPETPKQSDMPAGTFSEHPPSIVFKANPTRTSADPLATVGDPAAALANALSLAKDTAALAAQQREAAKSVDHLADAADKLLTDNHRGSLRASLLAMLMSVVLFNLNADADMAPGSMVTSSLGALTPSADPFVAKALRPAVVETRQFYIRGQRDDVDDSVIFVKQLEYQGNILALGVDFYLDETFRTIMHMTDTIPEDGRYVAVVRQEGGIGDALNRASSFASQAADTRSLGAVPGNLVYAAYRDESPSGTLEAALAALPSRVAQQLGCGPTIVSLVRKITQDLAEPDNRIDDLPDLFLGQDPEIPLDRRILSAFIDLVLWIRGQADMLPVLRQYESLVSSLGLLFVEQVQKENVLDYATLADRVKDDKLTFEERTAFRDLCSAWDRASQSVSLTIPDGSPTPVVEFLTRILAIGVPVGSSLLGLYISYRLLLSSLSETGTDVIYAATAASALWRSILILDSTLSDEDASKRLKVIFKSGAVFYDKVTNLPNKGSLTRLLEVLP